MVNKLGTRLLVTDEKVLEPSIEAPLKNTLFEPLIEFDCKAIVPLTVAPSRPFPERSNQRVILLPDKVKLLDAVASSHNCIPGTIVGKNISGFNVRFDVNAKGGQ